MRARVPVSSCALAWALVPALLALGLGGCRGARLPVQGAPTPAPTRVPRPAPPAQPATPMQFEKVRGKDVKLTERDLAPVDDWLSERNAQWIIGDVVDVYASKEYFASMLTMNAKIGLIHRQEAQVGEDTVTTLTYIGARFAASAMRNPRVKIGKDKDGLTVTARKTLRVRMAKTRDPSRPVQLRIVARGKASQGRHEKVARRGDQLELGGMLRRARGRWVWVPVQR